MIVQTTSCNFGSCKSRSELGGQNERGHWVGRDYLRKDFARDVSQILSSCWTMMVKLGVEDLSWRTSIPLTLSELSRYLSGGRRAEGVWMALG